MSEITRIQEQLRRAFEGEAWHGPAVLEALDGVDAAKAAARPVPGAHSIWEIALHIAAWKRIVAQRVSGKPPEVTTEMDWPPVRETGDGPWRRVFDELREAQRTLIEAAAQVSDARLDEPLYRGGNSAYVQLHGVAQHDTYHAGQISLLKKNLS